METKNRTELILLGTNFLTPNTDHQHEKQPLFGLGNIYGIPLQFFGSNTFEVTNETEFILLT